MARGSSDFEEFYVNGHAAVYKAVLVFAGDSHLAEEATQESFARALERWPRLSKEPWALGWVITTALNLVRRANRRGRDDLQQREVTESDADTSIDLWHAVRSLPRRQQEAIALHYVADLPVDRVAAAMGCEKGTVKAHLWRARRQLAKRLGVAEDA